MVALPFLALLVEIAAVDVHRVVGRLGQRQDLQLPDVRRVLPVHQRLVAVHLVARPDGARRVLPEVNLVAEHLQAGDEHLNFLIFSLSSLFTSIAQKKTIKRV